MQRLPWWVEVTPNYTSDETNGGSSTLLHLHRDVSIDVAHMKV